MLQPRATAQQAIEVLKVHQLRKENVIIFEEIKRLRAEVTSRDYELNDALKQVADLKAQLKEATDSAVDRDKMVEALKISSEFNRASIERLRQDLEVAKEDLTRKLQLQQTTTQQTDSTTKALREDIVQLRRQIGSTDNKTADPIERLNRALDEKAEYQAVSKVKARLDQLGQLVQNLETGFETRESVSRVTDTAEELVGQSSDQDLPSTHRYKESMWKPIGSALEVETPTQQDPSTMAQQITGEGTEDNSLALLPLHAEADLRRKTISNIHHEITNRDEQSALVARPDTAQQENVPEQPSKQQDNRTVSNEHRPGAALLPSPQAKIAREHTAPEVMREALYAILKLAQGADGSLVHYLARFRDFLALVRADEEVAGICLTWFLGGLAEHEERFPIEEWLRASECPLQAVRDCIVVLIRCWSSSNLEPQDRLSPTDKPTADPGGTARKRTISETPISRKNVEHANMNQNGLFPKESLEEVHSPLVGNSHAQESRPSSPVRKDLGTGAAFHAAAPDQASVQAGMERNARGKSCGKHADSKKATKAGSVQGEKRQSQAKALKREKMANVVRSEKEKPPVQRAAAPEITVTATKIPRMLAELSSFNRPLPPQEVVEDPTKRSLRSVKRRGIFDPPEDSDEECMPSSPPNKIQPSPRTPIPRARGRSNVISRVPTLVRLERARSANSQASDPIRLPPVRCQKRQRRKLRDDTPPDIPILTLTPSDFNEQKACQLAL